MDELKAQLLNKTKTTKEFELSIDDVAALIKAGSVKNVVVCAGAGISSESRSDGIYTILTKL